MSLEVTSSPPGQTACSKQFSIILEAAPAILASLSELESVGCDYLGKTERDTAMAATKAPPTPDSDTYQ
jgi:hypothetical protein